AERRPAPGPPGGGSEAGRRALTPRPVIRSTGGVVPHRRHGLACHARHRALIPPALPPTARERGEPVIRRSEIWPPTHHFHSRPWPAAMLSPDSAGEGYRSSTPMGRSRAAPSARARV